MIILYSISDSILAGDIAYADYWLKEEIQGFLPNTTIEGGAKVYESLLNQFYDEMTAVTGVKPYMVGPGNHEANCTHFPPPDFYLESLLPLLELNELIQ